MKRFKLFISNFIVYGLGGVIGKLVPLIMLPVITRLMPDTAYFGLNDISVTVVSFATYLGIMGMYDAMFRMFFDQEDEDYKKRVCSSTLAFTLCTSILIFGILFLFRIPLSRVIFRGEQYTKLLLVSATSALIGTTNSIVSAPTRLMNKRKVFLITNTLSSVISYGIAIPLLIKGWYLLALPLASVISVAILEITFGILNHEWFSVKKIDIRLMKQMLVIALPLLPNFLVYWIFNSADRLMISAMLGNEYTGIYAIGGKLGNVSQLIYAAFAGGWQYFAFSTMKDEDQVQLNSNIFEYLFAVTIFAGTFMMTFSQLIFELLFEGDYVGGALVAPYLFIAPLLLMLYQVGCNQFLVIKKTSFNFAILLIGAVTNVALNVILIPRVGVEGAAIATLVGYGASVVLCVVVLKKMKLLFTSGRLYFITGLFIVYIILWRTILLNRFVISIFGFAGMVLLMWALYHKDVRRLLHH